MYGRKKKRQYHLRSRHPNCPRTEHVPATEVLGIGSDSGEAAKTASARVSYGRSEIEMVLFFYINSDFAINCSQSI